MFFNLGVMWMPVSAANGAAGGVAGGGDTEANLILTLSILVLVHCMAVNIFKGSII
jgi:hypothetical protein